MLFIGSRPGVGLEEPMEKMDERLYGMISKRRSFHLFRNIGTLWYGAGKADDLSWDGLVNGGFLSIK